MKKKYDSPEFDLMKIRFDRIMDDDMYNIRHSVPEGFAEGGEEGPNS